MACTPSPQKRSEPPESSEKATAKPKATAMFFFLKCNQTSNITVYVSACPRCVVSTSAACQSPRWFLVFLLGKHRFEV